MLKWESFDVNDIVKYCYLDHSLNDVAAQGVRLKAKCWSHIFKKCLPISSTRSLSTDPAYNTVERYNEYSPLLLVSLIPPCDTRISGGQVHERMAEKLRMENFSVQFFSNLLITGASGVGKTLAALNLRLSTNKLVINIKFIEHGRFLDPFQSLLERLGVLRKACSDPKSYFIRSYYLIERWVLCFLQYSVEICECALDNVKKDQPTLSDENVGKIVLEIVMRAQTNTVAITNIQHLFSLVHLDSILEKVICYYFKTLRKGCIFVLLLALSFSTMKSMHWQIMKD